MTAIGFVLVGIGVAAVWSGIKGESLPDVLKAVLTGEPLPKTGKLKTGGLEATPTAAPSSTPNAGASGPVVTF